MPITESLMSKNFPLSKSLLYDIISAINFFSNWWTQSIEVQSTAVFYREWMKKKSVATDNTITLTDVLIIQFSLSYPHFFPLSSKCTAHFRGRLRTRVSHKCFVKMYPRCPYGQRIRSLCFLMAIRQIILNRLH